MLPVRGVHASVFLPYAFYSLTYLPGVIQMNFELCIRTLSRLCVLVCVCVWGREGGGRVEGGGRDGGRERGGGREGGAGNEAIAITAPTKVKLYCFSFFTCPYYMHGQFLNY